MPLHVWSFIRILGSLDSGRLILGGWVLIWVFKKLCNFPISHAPARPASAEAFPPPPLICLTEVECLTPTLFIISIVIHKRPHASIPRQHLPALLNHLTLHKFDAKNVIIMQSTKSHFHPKVLSVFNSGTKEFFAIEEAFDLVDFRTSLDLVPASAGSHGNKQVNAGFTSQSLNTRCPVTGVSQPSMFTGTRDIIPGFEALSTLASHAMAFIQDSNSAFSDTPQTRSSQASFRHAKFAGTISPHNTMEYMAPTLNDKDNPLVLAHIDTKNDPGASHSTIITASRLLVVSTLPSCVPELKRVVQIGTHRKACSDFMQRVLASGSLIRSLVLFHQSLGTNRSFVPGALLDISGRTRVIYPDCLLTPANGDRCIQESATCFCISYFLEHGNPQSIKEVYEVAICSVWVTEPRKFLWMVQE